MHPLQERTPLLTPQVLICSVGTEIFVLTRESYNPGVKARGDAARLITVSLESQLPDGGFVGWLESGKLQQREVEKDSQSSRDGSRSFLKYKQDTSWEQYLDGDGWDAEKILAVISSTIPQLKIQVSNCMYCEATACTARQLNVLRGNCMYCEVSNCMYYEVSNCMYCEATACTAR